MVYSMLILNCLWQQSLPPGFLSLGSFVFVIPVAITIAVAVTIPVTIPIPIPIPVPVPVPIAVPIAIAIAIGGFDFVIIHYNTAIL
jgi:hypothetical protein